MSSQRPCLHTRKTRRTLERYGSKHGFAGTMLAFSNDIPLHCRQAGLPSSHFTLRVLQLEHPRLDFVCALRLRRALGTAVEVLGEIVMRDRNRD
jgi:hypothetical protein